MIKIGSALIEYAEQLERERGIPRQFIFESLKEAMLAAYKRYASLNNAEIEGFSCKLIEKTGEIGVFEHRIVVDELIDPRDKAKELEELRLAAEEAEQEFEPPFELSSFLPLRRQVLLADARKQKADIRVGEELITDVTPSEFGRIAAQSAKQVITQRIRESEKILIQKEFEEKKSTVVPALVQRVEGNNVVVNIGRSDALLPTREQLPGEVYRVGSKLRVYVSELRDSSRVPQIIVSQAHAALVREVFELEVPEIEDGLVEIKSIAREAGDRTKVAVHSPDPEVDAQGACIGTRGGRIQAIVSELNNEKIDIIRWNEDPAIFIVNALAPAHVLEVRIHPNPEKRDALVVVSDDQLSLAIGRQGQNVRLAAKLTGYKLDIKSDSQFQELRQRMLSMKRSGEATEAPSASAGENVLAATLEMADN